MAKHLFRINYTNPTTKEEEILCEKTESFQVSDEVLSKYLDVHVLELKCNRKLHDVPPWGCENVVEWFNEFLMVKEPLSKNKYFKKLMKQIRYKKEIVPQDTLAEGGCYVHGEKLIFLSNVFKKKSFEDIAKKEEQDITFHTMPSITSTQHFHINCDYLIIDAAKIIYGSDNVFNLKGPIPEQTKDNLEQIATTCGYELREYPASKKQIVVKNEDLSPIDGMDSKIWTPNQGDYTHLEEIKKWHGINAIVDGNRLFTGYIDNGETKYLESKGIKVVRVPLGKISVGAGLKCVYGEFTI